MQSDAGKVVFADLRRCNSISLLFCIFISQRHCLVNIAAAEVSGPDNVACACLPPGGRGTAKRWKEHAGTKAKPHPLQNAIR